MEAGVRAPRLLLRFCCLWFQCRHLLNHFANLLLYLSMLSRRVSISRTQLISLLIGRSSSSFALMNAIASLRLAMSSVAVAVVDVARVFLVGIVWKFAIADVLRNVARHGWVVRWRSSLEIPYYRSKGNQNVSKSHSQCIKNHKSSKYLLGNSSNISQIHKAFYQFLL